ncbi:MAG: hypothetical protein ABWY45_09640 [Mycobacterium sp.]
MSRAEQLARDAVARSDDLECRLVLAQALAWQGRGRDAEDVLAGSESGELFETDLLAVALPRAANQFWMLSEPERATAYLRKVRNRVAESTGRTIPARHPVRPVRPGAQAVPDVATGRGQRPHGAVAAARHAAQMA